LGQKRLCAFPCRLSGLPTRADAREQHGGQLRANRDQNAPQQSCVLFDHLVDARKQRRRHSDAERPRGFEVDQEVELGRLLDWHVGRLLAR